MQRDARNVLMLILFALFPEHRFYGQAILFYYRFCMQVMEI